MWFKSKGEVDQKSLRNPQLLHFSAVKKNAAMQHDFVSIVITGTKGGGATKKRLSQILETASFFCYCF
jgi:folylpolyglutamate synthase/dihydropteroate synthase